MTELWLALWTLAVFGMGYALGGSAASNRIHHRQARLRDEQMMIREAINSHREAPR